MTGEPTHTASKERNGAVCPSYINYHLKSEISLTLHCQLCSTHYKSRTSAIKVASMKNTDDFHYERKPSCATSISTLFAVSKDEWDTKEVTGKSMKNAMHVLWYAKRHLSGRSDIKWQ